MSRYGETGGSYEHTTWLVVLPGANRATCLVSCANEWSMIYSWGAIIQDGIQMCKGVDATCTVAVMFVDASRDTAARLATRTVTPIDGSS